MDNVELEIARYKALKEAVEDWDEVIGVIDAETYVPPHKSAAFTPYDAVVSFKEVHWGSGDVEALFDEREIEYDYICGFTENDSRLEGEGLAFVSLVDYSIDN